MTTKQLVEHLTRLDSEVEELLAQREPLREKILAQARTDALKIAQKADATRDERRANAITAQQQTLLKEKERIITQATKEAERIILSAREKNPAAVDHLIAALYEEARQ